MDVLLLGPPGVRAGAELRATAGRQRALLALLAIHAPRPVSADRLVDALWGDAPPADPANALQQLVSRLRKAVDPDRRGDVLLPTPAGYALHLADDHLDVRRFERQAARGRELLAAGDPHVALRELSDALDLWRGPALDGLADEPWAAAEVHRLTELRLAAHEDRIDAALAVGEGAALIGELTDLLAANPLRERLAGQLMVALYRAGRQADALEVYERTRRLLADELGVDPGPDLQAVHRRVLQQDPGLAGGPRAPSAPAHHPPADGPAGNLPAPTGRVIGRDAAVEQVGRLLAGSRLVTLTGPGGAGKTTLAIEAARQHATDVRDGAWLVELAGLAPEATEDVLVDAVVTALGLRTGGLGGAGPDLAALTAALSDRDPLLLLDNAEHVVESACRLVEVLLARAPGMRILVTSREPLGATGEVVWSIPTLGVPPEGATELEEVLAAPAVALLVERARAGDPDFALTPDTAPDAVGLVRRLDGVPLAIELAAARLRVMTLPELVAGLADRFAVLTGRARTAPSRQRTLRGALDWSWDLLGGRERRAWAALAVPAGWFDQGLAGPLLAAAGVDGPALDALADLVDRSVLTPDTSVVPARYRMLETVREYGRERLDGLGIGPDVHARHADAVEAALAACHDDRDPTVFGVDLAGLEAWLEEARLALAWADTVGERDRMQRIAGRLGWLWLLRRHATEGIRWLDRALGDPEVEDVDPDAALWASALRASDANPDADRWARRSLAVADTPAQRALAGVFAAAHHAHAGRVDDALAQLEASRQEGAAVGGWPLGWAELITAQILRLTGRMDEVHAHAESALALLTDAGVDWARAYALDLVIDRLDAGGEYERARALATDGLALCRAHGFPELESRMLVQLGTALHALGEVEAARDRLAEAVAVIAATGEGPSLGYTLVVAGALARRRGDLEEATDHLTHAAGLLATTGAAYGAVWVAVEQALTAAQAGAGAEASRHAEAAVSGARAIGAPAVLARAQEALAAAHLAAGDTDVALAELAAADRLRREARVPPSPAEQADLAAVRDGVRARLGTGFAAAWAAALDGAAAAAGTSTAGAEPE